MIIWCAQCALFPTTDYFTHDYAAWHMYDISNICIKLVVPLFLSSSVQPPAKKEMNLRSDQNPVTFERAHAILHDSAFRQDV